MRLDPLKQFATLHRRLLEEKARLESRLAQLYEVLPPESAPGTTRTGKQLKAGRAPGAPKVLSLREAITLALAKGPMGRQQLVKAVQDLGYVFRTKDPLNSMGVILYAKNAPYQKKEGLFFLPASAQPQTPLSSVRAAALSTKRSISRDDRPRA